MKRIGFLISALIACAPAYAGVFRLASPDSRLESLVAVEGGSISYSLDYDGRPVVLRSALTLDFDNHIWEMATGKRSLPELDSWFDNLILDSAVTSGRDTLWHNRFGERSTVRDNFNALALRFRKDDGSNCRLDLEFRLYDNALAFRFRIPMHPDALYHRLIADNCEFAFPEGTMAWHQAWAQAQHTLVPLEEWAEDAERPLTLRLTDGTFAAIGEAGVIDFPRGKIRLLEKNRLAVSLNDNATDIVTPCAMPWRVVMVADSAAGLVEGNDIFLNLNESSRIADDSWIRPGKIMRETRLTTENSFKVIDFCAAHGIDYILYDWKWYGPSFDFASDATQVVAPIDMPAVVAHGREKGVGVWVYVNQHALQKQGAELFREYEKWGLKGVKFGFVQFTSQHWADWVHRLVRQAADSHIMVNIHDEYRPTGYSRTWPNLLTQEGICGNEEFPDATHNTILPFTRMLCGAADYTFCYFDPRLKTTHAHQLALPIIYFSPLQTLYWYDYPERMTEVPEMAFWRDMPTVWDDTRVLVDRIGECVAVARRSGEDWWIGVISGNEGAVVEIPLDFLPAGRFEMVSWYDDPSADSPTHVASRSETVRTGAGRKASKSLNFTIPPSGGIALTLKPDNSK